MPPVHPNVIVDTLSEIASSYRATLLATSAVSRILLVVVGLALAIAAAWRVSGKRSAGARYGFVAAAVIGAVAYAWSLAWICDDACISLRYASNLARGNGLVWNVGERVEGYTDFLWTVLLALCIRVGIDGQAASVFLGLGSLVVLVMLVARLGGPSSSRVPGSSSFSSFSLASFGSWTGPVVPIAAFWFASSYVVASFGTSGLETMMAAALITLALERCIHGHPLQAGFAGVASALCHPDHLILYLCLGAVLVLDPKRRREIVAFLVPMGVVFVPWFLWRWHYYGQMMPNTYYAKSGGDAYFSQGIVYLVANFLGAGWWALLPLAALGTARRLDTFLGRYTVLGGVLYSIYVMKIGGDFMFGRLWVPVLPLLFVAAENGLRDCLATRRWVLLVATVPVLALVAMPLTLIKPLEKKWMLSDERTFYSDPGPSRLEARSHYVEWGTVLEKTFGDLRPKPLLAIQSVGMVGYFSTFPILDIYGLNSPEVAHQILTRRGRPGHEKKASPGFVFESHAIVAEVEIYPPPYDDLTIAHVGPALLRVPRYDPKVVAGIRKQKGHTLLDPKKQIDEYVVPASPARAACDLWFWNAYYFEPQGDAARRKTMTEKLVTAKVLAPEARDLFVDARGWDHTTLFDFDAPGLDGWVTTGDAFLDNPVVVSPPGQVAASGYKGRYLDTFQAKALDHAMGRLQSPAFTLEGDVLSLQIAGGISADVGVDLIVDGVAVRTASGCDWEIFGQRLWGISDLRGKTAFLQVRDRATGGWGHILLDQVEQWTRPAGERGER